MPRDISPEFDSALGTRVTAPLFVCHLTLHGEDFYLTSFDDKVLFDNVLPGQLFQDANLEVSGPSQKSGGTLQATIRIPYDTKSVNNINITDLLLTNRPQDQPVKLWQTYWHNDAYTPPLLLMDALVDDVKLGRTSGATKPKVSFVIVSRGNRGGQTPAIRLGRPMLNHLTPKGSVVLWNKGRWEID